MPANKTFILPSLLYLTQIGLPCIHTRQSDVRRKHCSNANGRHFYSRFKGLADDYDVWLNKCS